MSHVDEGLLHAWLDGGLEPGDAEVAEVAAHLASCALCRGRLDEARALKEGAQRVLHHAAPPEMRVPPFDDVRARRAGVAAATAGPARARWFRPVRLAWAASIAVALGAGWMANELFLVSRASLASDAEMITPQQAQSPSVDDAATQAQTVILPAEAKAAADLATGASPDREAAGLAGAEAMKANTAPIAPTTVPPPARRNESVLLDRAGMALDLRADSMTLMRQDSPRGLGGRAARAAELPEGRLRLQANEAAAIAAAPSPGQVSATAEHVALLDDYVVADSAVTWSPASPEVVAFQLGRAAAAVEGARLDRTETGVANGRTLIRAHYTLEDGSRVELIQRAKPIGKARAAQQQEAVTEAKLGAVAARGAFAERDRRFDGESILLLDLPGLTLVIKGAIPEDSLRAIATRIR